MALQDKLSRCFDHRVVVVFQLFQHFLHMAKVRCQWWNTLILPWHISSKVLPFQNRSKFSGFLHCSKASWTICKNCLTLALSHCMDGTLFVNTAEHCLSITQPRSTDFYLAPLFMALLFASKEKWKTFFITVGYFGISGYFSLKNWLSFFKNWPVFSENRLVFFWKYNIAFDGKLALLLYFWYFPWNLATFFKLENQITYLIYLI